MTATKLVPVGYGIKMFQIMMTIVYDLMSIDTFIEERLCEEPLMSNSCDIVFNKFCKFIVLNKYFLKLYD